jgi:glutamate carboxypeptidase
VDIKGGTAMIWMMLDALKTVNPTLFHSVRWMVLLNAAEEIINPHFGEVSREVLPANTKACLIFEAGGMHKSTFTLTEARKGSGHFQLHVTGRAAHSGSNYEKGANAIRQMSRVIERIMDLTDLEHGATTVNVGKIEGGTVHNKVPDEAHAALEIRSFDENQYRKVRDAFLAMNGPGDVKSPDGNATCHIEFVKTLEHLPWPQNPQTETLIAHWQAAAADCGFEIARRASGGLSDGNLLWNHFPTLDGLGPMGANLHCSRRSEDGSEEQEYVDVSSFVPKALLNCLAIEKIIAENNSPL